MLLHEEIHTMFEVDEEKIESNEWNDMIDAQIFKFKRRVYTWLKNGEEDWMSFTVPQKPICQELVAVANQMLQRDPVAAINLITLKQVQ